VPCWAFVFAAVPECRDLLDFAECLAGYQIAHPATHRVLDPDLELLPGDKQCPVCFSKQGTKLD